MSRVRAKSDGWVRIFEVPCFEKHEQGYTVYKVISKVFPCQSPEACSEITAWKRYSQFRKLHKEMSTLHAALYLKGTFPPLPKASFFNRFDTVVMEERRAAVHTLLEFVALHPPLFTSAVFVKFFEDGDCRTVNPLDRLPPPPLSPDTSLASFSDAPTTPEATGSQLPDQLSGGDQLTGGDSQLTALLDPLAPQKAEDKEPAPSNLQLLTEPDLLKDLNMAPSAGSRTLRIDSEHDLSDLPELPDLPEPPDDGDLPSASDAMRQSEEVDSGGLARLSLGGATARDPSARLPYPPADLTGGDTHTEGSTPVASNTGITSYAPVPGDTADPCNTPVTGTSDMPVNGSGDGFLNRQLPYPHGSQDSLKYPEPPYPVSSAAKSGLTSSFPELPDSKTPKPATETPTQPIKFRGESSVRPSASVHGSSSSLPESAENDTQLPYPKTARGQSVPFPSPIQPLPCPPTNEEPAVPVSANQEPASSLSANQEPVSSLSTNEESAPPTSANQNPAGGDEGPGQYLLMAAGIIGEAQRAETQCEWEAAFAHYQQAIGVLINGVQGDPCAERRVAVKRKTALYIGRAEQLADLCSQVAPQSSERRLSLHCVEGGRRLAAFRVTGVRGRLIIVSETDTGKQFAIKVVQRSARADPAAATLLPQKIPHMVQLHQLLQTEHAYFLVLQYMPHGLLFDPLPNRPLPSRATSKTTLHPPESDPHLPDTAILRASSSAQHPETVPAGGEASINQDPRGGSQVSLCALTEPRHEEGTKGLDVARVADGLEVLRVSGSDISSDDQQQDAPTSYLNLCQQFADTQRRCGSVGLARNLSHEGTVDSNEGREESRHSPQDSQGPINQALKGDDFSSVTERRKDDLVSNDGCVSGIDSVLRKAEEILNRVGEIRDKVGETPNTGGELPDTAKEAPQETAGEPPDSPVSRSLRLLSAVDQTLQQSCRLDTGSDGFQLVLPAAETVRGTMCLSVSTDQSGSSGGGVGEFTESVSFSGCRAGITDSRGMLGSSTILECCASDASPILRSGEDINSERELNSQMTESGAALKSHEARTVGAALTECVGTDLCSGSFSHSLSTTDAPSHVPQDTMHIIGSSDDMRTSFTSATLSTTDSHGTDNSAIPWWSRGSIAPVPVRAPIERPGEAVEEIEDAEEYEERVRTWAAQMVCALDALHIQGILCRDLHPANLLLTASGGVCLTYFCQLGPTNHHLHLSPTAVSGLYTAPELAMRLDGQPASPAADWWSLGAMLYELSGRRVSLKDSHPAGVWPHTRLKMPEGAPQLLCSLLVGLLQVRPEDRPSVEAIKRHPYFRGVDWDEVASGT